MLYLLLIILQWSYTSNILRYDLESFTSYNFYDFIIALSGADIGGIWSNPNLLKKFEDEFQSKVWFVEAQAADKRFIENLFFPVKVLAVNMLWLPDGHKLTKVIISASDKIEAQQRYPNIEKVKQIARHIELLVEFENPN